MGHPTCESIPWKIEYNSLHLIIIINCSQVAKLQSSLTTYHCSTEANKGETTWLNFAVSSGIDYLMRRAH